MLIFCCGFNLYNQLKGSDICIVDFCPTIEEDLVDCIELKHSFTLVKSNNLLKIYCNLIPNSTFEYNNISNIKQIVANDNIILILNDIGELYKATIENLDLIKPVPKFSESNEKIKFVSCGSRINVAYTELGSLYSIPEKLEFENLDIVDIKTGREHCVVLDKLGNVYTFGRGSRGQLGHGNLDDEANPKLVEAVAGIKISIIACGGWHSTAISKDGDLYIWGWNGNGQLGLSTSGNEDKVVSVMATPHIADVEGCSDKNIKLVACGTRHTLILLDDNCLYGCGWNKYKQLKNEEQENYNSFVFLHDFSKESVEQIACGPWNSAVICK